MGLKKLKKNLLIVFLLCGIFFFKENKSYAVLNLEFLGEYVTTPSNVIDLVEYIYGGGVGLGVDVFRIQSWIMVQLRTDVKVTLFYYPDLPLRSNFPIFLGGRFLFGGGVLPKFFVPYIEVGYKLIIKRDFVAGAPQILNHSMAAGLGTEFFFTRLFYFTFNFRVNIIDMDFFSIGGGLGFRL